MNITDYKINGYKEIDTENEDNTSVITLSDSSGVLSFIRDDNLVYFSYGENGWLKVKNNSNLTKTEVELYYDKNLESDVRDTYINFINKQTGFIETFFITQEQCNYDIVVGSEDYCFIDKDTPINIDFSVYGNTRKCTITNEHFSIVKENEKYYPFDRSLCFKLTKISDDEEKKCTNYQLTVEYIGNISDLTENDRYNITLQHSDNRKTKKIISIDISAIINSENIKKEETLLKAVENLPSTINEYEQQNIENREKNYTVKDVNNTIILPLSINKVETPKLPAIVVDGIKDNIIFVQTNTYNGKGELEHDSMIVGTEMAYWCTIEDIYNAESEMHEITVDCEPNKFGIVRKGYLSLTNAERLTDRKKFLVTQDKENKVTISEI